MTLKSPHGLTHPLDLGTADNGVAHSCVSPFQQGLRAPSDLILLLDGIWDCPGFEKLGVYSGINI